MTNPKTKDWRDEFVKDFRYNLVEMNLLRDMHNRPPLYDVDYEKIDEIINFCQSFFNSTLAQVEAEAREEEIKRITMFFGKDAEDYGETPLHSKFRAFVVSKP